MATLAIDPTHSPAMSGPTAFDAVAVDAVAMGDPMDVESAPLEALEREICGWAGRIAAATCRMLLVLAAFDRRGGWSGLGMGSCAHWLAWRCGLSVRTAQDHMAVGHALAELPAVRAAFAAGRLSYSKVRAVARVADADTESTWLAHALHCTAGQVERLASRYHQLTADPSAQRAARKATWSTRSDGLFRLSAVLTAQEGARLAAAIDAARASLDDVSPPAEGEAAPVDGEVVAAHRDRRADADALVVLAEGFLRRPAPGLLDPAHTLTVHIDTDTLLAAGGGDARDGVALEPEHLSGQAGTRVRGAGGSSTPAPAPAPMDQADPSGDRAGGVAAAGQEARRPGTGGSGIGGSGTGESAGGDEPGGVCGTDGSVGSDRGRVDEAGRGSLEAIDGPADTGRAAKDTDPVSRLARGLLRCDAGPGVGLPRAVVSRLGCDALLRALVHDGAAGPLALGRRRRMPTRRLREAVYARDQGTCRYPGCARTRWLQIHHLREWLADEGETDLENLTLVCTRHHQLIHDEGTKLRRRADGTIVAVLPDGFVLLPAPRLDPGTRPAEALAAAVGHVSPDAIHTRDGGRLSWDDSLYILMRHRHPPTRRPPAAEQRD
ncbi:HNH endonuclease [Pseudofrankia asymbiotica]|uniref:HNH endonuclease n=1 Tax=Pseudofrankia asymbiotica TaxID=1834516 RepID=UPI0009D78E41|nr:HNH endonuclease [Pseudofrankia asymbiotica]